MRREQLASICLRIVILGGQFALVQGTYLIGPPSTFVNLNRALFISGIVTAATLVAQERIWVDDTVPVPAVLVLVGCTAAAASVFAAGPSLIAACFFVYSLSRSLERIEFNILLMRQSVWVAYLASILVLLIEAIAIGLGLAAGVSHNAARLLVPGIVLSVACGLVILVSLRAAWATGSPFQAHWLVESTHSALRSAPWWTILITASTTVTVLADRVVGGRYVEDEVQLASYLFILSLLSGLFAAATAVIDVERPGILARVKRRYRYAQAAILSRRMLRRISLLFLLFSVAAAGAVVLALPFVDSSPGVTPVLLLTISFGLLAALALPQAYLYAGMGRFPLAVAWVSATVARIATLMLFHRFGTVGLAASHLSGSAVLLGVGGWLVRRPHGKTRRL